MTDPNLELQESGWEELRREARKIEGDLEVKLSSYGKLGARFTQGGSSFFIPFSVMVVLRVLCFMYCHAFWLCRLYKLDW